MHFHFLAVSAALAVTGCTTVGYPAPARTTYDFDATKISILPLPTTAGPRLSLLARFQVQECRNIAAAYEKKAANRTQVATVLTVGGAILTALGGAGLAGSLVELPGVPDADKRLFGISGAVIVGVGAGTAAVLAGLDVLAGPKQHTAAAKGVADAVTKFVDEITELAFAKSAEVDASEAYFISRVCSLRSACVPSVVDVNGLGKVIKPAVPTPDLTLDLNRAEKLDDALEGLCGGAPIDQTCPAGGPCTPQH